MFEISEYIRRHYENNGSSVMRRGHTGGDLLEAYNWSLLEERSGFIKIKVHLPEHLKNPRGQLFGGYVPVYVDLIGLFAWYAGVRSDECLPWLATMNLSVDYLEPVTGVFTVSAEVLARRKGNGWVNVIFESMEGKPLILAKVALHEIS